MEQLHPRQQLLLLLLLLLLGTLAAAAAVAGSDDNTSSCVFAANGDATHRVVVPWTPENIARLDQSLVAVAHQLGLIGQHRPTEFDLHDADTGRRVKGVEDCAQLPMRTLVVVPRGDLFMYPPASVGHERIVVVAERPYTIRTLAMRPRAYEVADFLNEAECAHLIKLSGIPNKPTMYMHDQSSVVLTSADQMTQAILDRVGQLLHLPSQLLGMNDGFVVHRRGKQSASTGVVNPERDFIHRGDSPLYEGFHRGINQFVTVALFLNNVSSGGGLNVPLADLPNANRYVHESTTGQLQILLPGGVFACEAGATGEPRQGSLVFMYNLEPEGQGEGQPDPMAFYQMCNPVSNVQWWARLRITNKIIYDLRDVWILDSIDRIVGAILGLSLTDILTNGYGWDWAEDVLADASLRQQQRIVDETSSPLLQL